MVKIKLIFTPYFSVERLQHMFYNKNMDEYHHDYNKKKSQKKRLLKPIPPPPPTPLKIIPVPPPPTPSLKIIPVPSPPPTPSLKIIPVPPPTSSLKDDWNNIEKRFTWVKEKWNFLKKEHQLDGWMFQFNSRLRTTAGQCLYGKEKRIEIATLLINSPEIKKTDVLETLLHEVAHAIAGYKAAHGPIWKKIARELGCSGNTCHSLSFGNHK